MGAINWWNIPDGYVYDGENHYKSVRNEYP